MYRIQKSLLLWVFSMILMIIVGLSIGYWALGAAVLDWSKSLWEYWLLAVIIGSPFGIGGGIFFLRSWEHYRCAKVNLSRTDRERLWILNGSIILCFVCATLVSAYAEHPFEKGLLSGGFRMIFFGVMMSSFLITVFVFVSVSIILHCRDKQRYT